MVMPLLGIRYETQGIQSKNHKVLQPPGGPSGDMTSSPPHYNMLSAEIISSA